MRKLCFAATFIFFQMLAHSQKHDAERIDSLLTELQAASEDTNKVALYAEIMHAHVYFKTEQGLAYYDASLALAKKLNWKFGIAQINDRAGRIKWRLGKFDEALQNHFEAHKLYKQAGSRADAAYVLVEIGQDYLDGSKYPEAEAWLLKAVDAAQEAGEKILLADAYDKLTYLYDMQGNFTEATKTSYKYLEIVDETDDAVGITHAYYMLGMIAQEIGNNAEALKHYKRGLQLVTASGNKMYQVGFNNFVGDIYQATGDYSDAMKYYSSALTIAKEINDIPVLAATYQAIGKCYAALGNHKKAIANYLLSEAIFKKVSNKQDLAFLYASMGICYTSGKDYDAAKKTFAKAGLLYTEIGSKQLSMIDYYNGKHLLDSATGNWKDAYHNFQQYVVLRDSTYNKEVLKKMVTSQMQYETDKKDAVTKTMQEKKDLITQSEIRRQRNIKNSAFAVATLVLLFSAVLYRQRNKLAKEKKRSDLLLQDKELLLKEIHHRVKNNLEVVSSLLALQSAQIDDQQTKDAMQEGQNRVQSIGIVHQKLYQGTNLGAIEMKDYFINLGESILDSFGAAKRVTIECAMNQLDVDIDTAVPLGLIVNELLTNTLKYAFPPGQNGKVLIKLEKRPDGVLQLQISDDGVGKSGITHGTGFGGQLVSLLTQQLSGSMREEIKDGTHIYFEFKAAKAA